MSSLHSTYSDASLKPESTGSSDNSETPVALTASNQDVIPQRRNSSRRGSSTSQDNAAFSVRNIYGDLESDEIEVQRTATRTTIINELVQRVHENEYDQEKDQDEESSVGLDLCKHKSNISKYNDTFFAESTLPIENSGAEFNSIDPELIAWDGTDDPEDPRNWPARTKSIMIAFVSLYALVAPMSSSMLSPAMTEISEEFGITSGVVRSMVVSIQILAWALGPLLIAPLSEHDNFGRKIVLDVSVWMSLFFNLGCAFSQTTSQMMACRFIGGLFGCVPLNVGAGVISDLFEAKQRNVALAGYLLAPLLGPVIAPVASGFIVQNVQWRWVFYVLCMFNGFVAISATIVFRETYTPTLLRRKARKLRVETGNSNLHTIYEITDGETFLGKIWITMTRPIKLLFTHPMIVGLGSIMAFTYGFMYLMIVTFPTIFGTQYGFNKAITGLMYIPMGVGFVLGVLFWTFAIGKVYNDLTEKNGGVPKPEFRLPCLFGASLCIPIGLVWFGWSAQKQLHWIMPGVGSAIFAFGLVCVFQSTQNYLIDMNPRYAASSVAAAALFRSLFGFSFPLFANLMYDRLGYGWGNTMCAFIAIVLGIPFPIFCFFYGERIRRWADARLEADQKSRDKKNLETLRKMK